MATNASDSSYAGQRERAPISAHPAFSAIVALWFAALLGLGSLVLPPVLVERAIAASGLASLLPMMAAPLDMVARGAIAGFATAAGALMGIAIARRVASAQTQPSGRRLASSGDGLQCRPIIAREELGGSPLVNGEAMPVTRRRALAIIEEDGPSDYFYKAPLPGETLYGPPQPVFDTPEEAPLELCEPFVEPEAPFDPLQETALEEDLAMSERHDNRPGFGLGDESSRDSDPIAFSPPSFAGRRTVPDLDREWSAARPAIAPNEATPELPLAESAGLGEAESRDASGEPLDTLDLQALVQRLESTIERRCALRAQAAPEAARTERQAFEMAAPEDAARATAAYFGRRATAETEAQHDEPPSAFSAADDADTQEDVISPLAAPPPVSFFQSLADGADDEEEELDDLPAFSLPLSRMRASNFDLSSENDADESEEDTAYGSLLAMRNPFAGSAPAPVRIEEPESEEIEPAVVFPPALSEEEPPVSPLASQRPFDAPGRAPTGAAPPRPASPDTQDALRAALTTLQRMNGSA